MPFETFCTSDTVASSMPHELLPPLLNSLRYFVPDRLCDSNLSMKYSLQRDGPSMSMLFRNMCGLNAVLLAIEKTAGFSFGCWKNALLKNTKLNVLCVKLKIE